MSADQIAELIELGESDRLEFKSSTGERVEAARTACGMLNSLGGIILFGVRNDGTISGQDIGARTLEDLSAEWQKFEPPAFPDVSVTQLNNGRALIRVGVPGGGGPFTYDGRPYLRNGRTTVRMPQPHYEHLLLERLHATRRWETLPADGFDLDDLGTQDILRTVEEAIRRGRLDDPQTREIRELLTGLALYREGRLTNAAAVLFGKPTAIAARLPHCLLRMARFTGVDRSVFVDNRQEIGNAFTLLATAQRFIRDHLPIASRMAPDQFERIDEPLYPIEALREALANAICHRDYGDGSGSVGVAIYNDRLEISSTGSLPFGISVSDLLRPHESRPRNPLISEAFYRRGIIERWGRGTLKIAELNAAAGIPAPEFEERTGEVIVRFRPASPQTANRQSKSLTDLQIEILQILASNGPIPLRTIRESLREHYSTSSLQKSLATLRSAGLITLSGTNRGALWSIYQSDLSTRE